MYRGNPATLDVSGNLQKLQRQMDMMWDMLPVASFCYARSPRGMRTWLRLCSMIKRANRPAARETMLRAVQDNRKLLRDRSVRRRIVKLAFCNPNSRAVQ